MIKCGFKHTFTTFLWIKSTLKFTFYKNEPVWRIWQLDIWPQNIVYQSVTSRSREFPVPGILLLFGWYRYRYRKKLVPEKSTGTGTGKIWSRKKVPVPVSEKNGPGTVEFPGTPGHCIFSYLHVPLGTGKRKCPFKGSHHLRKLFF